MNRQVVFIQGGGEGGYEEDNVLAASLQTALGKGYDVYYPELSSDESTSDFGWPQQIGRLMSEVPDNSMFVGHSLGASMIVKYLSENAVAKKISGVFLLATPFWSGSEDWKAGLKLQEDFAERLPAKVPVFFYHCQDDDTVPFSHLNQYKQKCKQGIFRELKQGGHLFNHDLSIIAKDIKTV